MKQFFNLKSNFYFLQKIVFAIFCFILGFLFGSGILKANAANEVIYDYEIGYKQFKEQDYTVNFGGVELDNVESAMKELNKVLSENDINYIMTADFSGSFGKYRFADITIFEYSDSITELTTKKNSDDTSVTFSTETNFLKYVRVKGQIAYQNNKQMTPILQKLIEYIKQNKRLPSSTSEFSNVTIGSYPGFSTTFYNDFFNGAMIYSSNMTLRLGKMTGFDGLEIGNTVYKENSTFPTYMDTIGYGYEKKAYTENLRISSSNIDRIEYTFQLENDSPIHEFNFSTTWYSNIARLDLFSSPYLEYVQNNVSYKLPLDRHKESTLDEVVYYDMQINPFMDIQELKFVVDFNNINNLNEGANSEVLIHFDSSLNFERKIIYADDVDSSLKYYEEVDWSNKYGVYLIPKVFKNDVSQEVYSNVLYHAKGLKIDVFDSIDTSIPPVSTKHDYNNVGGIWGNFKYLFRFNNKNQMLFFTNKDYLTDSEPTKIKYDTRYFVYSVCDTEYNCQPVMNPNTGEEMRPTPPVDKEEWNLDDIFDVLDDFLVQIKETRNYFNECFNSFWSQVPNAIQTLIIVIYIMLNIVILLRIGGWSND